jgi:hypothetical protein
MESMLQTNMCRRLLLCQRILVLLLIASLPALGATELEQSASAQEQSDHPMQVPAGVLIVKGAWSSSSDSSTPVPEGGALSAQAYSNAYFGLTYPLPAGWIQKFEGPPPSDTGAYVLAQLEPAAEYKGKMVGTVLITAQDMFFTPSPAQNALELVRYSADHLEADYKVEQPAGEVQLAGHSFVRLAYESRATGLHWYVLATQIRCHTVQFVFTSRDPRVIKGLLQSMSTMTLSDPGAEGGTGDTPVCVEDYANGANVLSRVDPFFTERRFNRLPVRLIIDTNGRVKHIHFISAFPDQEKIITDALTHWRFMPYTVNGQSVELETGILFGRVPQPGEFAGRQ